MTEVNPRRKARLDAGLSAAEVAKRARMALSTYRAFETGSRTPNLEVALRLSKVLGCDCGIYVIPWGDKRRFLTGRASSKKAKAAA